MSSVLFRFIFASFSTFAAIALPCNAVAQVQDTIWEKAYCLDDKGTEIRFEHVDGKIPPSGTGNAYSANIEGDVEELYEMSYAAAQFLFARACFQAANINLDLRETEKLECQTIRFLKRRFSARPQEILRIVTELGNREDTFHVARELKSCL